MRISDWSSDGCSSDLKSVPAPQSAVAGHQPLADAKADRAVIGLRHAHLRQPAGKLGRGRDTGGERFHALRQRRVCFMRSAPTHPHRIPPPNGGVQLIATRRRKRPIKAGRYREGGVEKAWVRRVWAWCTPGRLTQENKHKT